jgi:hypothetical protein
VACAATVALAADQTILGKALTVKDPKPGVDATKRKVDVTGKEENSPNTLVGNPTQAGSAGGAILEVFANGASSTNQAFVLAQGMSNTGKPFWSGDGMKGFKYKDEEGDQGAVKSVSIKRASNGSFSVKIKMSRKGGVLAVLPPDPGTDGCAALKLGLAGGAGDRYSLRFGPDSTIKNSGAMLFSAKTPTAEGSCRALVPCGSSPFPTCGDSCPDGGVCGAVRAPNSSECGCFARNDECGGSCSFQCTSPQDCDAGVSGCSGSLAGTCPSGSICTVAIAHVDACGPGLCINVVAMCVP